jgi:hypothetical protein
MQIRRSKIFAASYCICLLLSCLLCAHVATASTIGNAVGQDVSDPDDGTGNLPPSDLSGWFFSLDRRPLASTPGLSEADFSQAWTSAQNIATLNYWLSLVMELGDDPTLIAGLDGLGMADSPASAKPQFDEPGPAVSHPSPGSVPEPVTAGLFAGGLLFLGLYAKKRARRTRLSNTTG